MYSYTTQVLKGLFVMHLITLFGEQLQRQLSEMGSKRLSTAIKRRIFLAILSQDLQFFEENNVRQLFSITESVEHTIIMLLDWPIQVALTHPLHPPPLTLTHDTGGDCH
jgi:hypothetical protein